MTAFVLGNGVSRKGIDPDMLKQHGRVFGLNVMAVLIGHADRLLIRAADNYIQNIKE
jgi:hypothetical protein